jgi:hypothetical protein
MKLDIETIAPFILICVLGATLYFNNSTPTVSTNGYSVVIPDRKVEIMRGVNDAKEEDNVVKLHHIDKPEDVLDLRLWHGYVVFPRDKDGNPIIPTRTKDDGTKEPIWTLNQTRKEFIFEPGWDFGAYAGYLGGGKEGTDIKDFDVGLRVSPLRIWNTFALDGLISNQAAGVGVSVYPAPERYGEIWSNLGLGYGRVITYDDDSQRNLFYFSFSTKF